MKETCVWLTGGLLAYLLGAVPFGLLIARMRGVDIRTVGSRNIGATNVYRSVGKSWGLLTFALDFAKGYAGAALLPGLAARLCGLPPPPGLNLACGALAVAGHNWPVYLGFKGGKGVATSAGLLLGLAPAACGLALGAWVVVLLLGRIVSLASIAAALTLGAAVWMAPFAPPGRTGLRAALTLLAAVAIARHHTNIRRLLAGTESRISFGRRASGGAE